jgi:aminoglycoside phosphotransferase (APT) family kinase protein
LTLEPELLALLPGCESGQAPLGVERLAGGSVNRTLLVHTARGRFVARLASPLSAELGVDRRREVAFQSLAARAGLAPAIVAASADARIVIAEYLPGRLWTPAALEDPAALERLGLRLAAMHRIQVPPELAVPRFDPLRQVRRLAARLPRTEPAEARRLEALLRDAARSLAAGGGPRDPTLLHLDLHPGNLLEADQLVFLDWEYAACGDPALELASLLAFDPQRDLDAERLASASGLASRLAAAELGALRRVFEITHWLWYRVRRQGGAPDAAECAVEEALRRRLDLP